MSVVDALLGDVADLAELDAVVDAERKLRSPSACALTSVAGRAQRGQDVGQVELALRVVGASASSAASTAAPSKAKIELLTSRIASCSFVASPAIFVSTTRSMWPSSSRMTRP